MLILNVWLILFSVIGYSKEQFDRVSDTLILLLANPEADYRLIAATNLANLKTETKSIDIALLYSFANDPRVNYLCLAFFSLTTFRIT